MQLGIVTELQNHNHSENNVLFYLAFVDFFTPAIPGSAVIPSTLYTLTQHGAQLFHLLHTYLHYLLTVSLLHIVEHIFISLRHCDLKLRIPFRNCMNTQPRRPICYFIVSVDGGNVQYTYNICDSLFKKIF